MDNQLETIAPTASAKPKKSPKKNRHTKIAIGYYTAIQLAEYLSICPRQVAREYSKGNLPEPVRFGKKCVRWCSDKIHRWKLINRPKRATFEPYWQAEIEKLLN